MAYLVIVRHGESEWNAKGLWTGWTDVDLTQKGKEEAYKAGEAVRDIHFDIAYVSALKRSRQTLDEMMDAAKQNNVSVIADKALNERDYGDLTGKNKWKIKEEYGDEQFLKWRRGWDDQLPHGESLKDVYARVIPYYQKEILPHLEKGENVLVAIHGNSMRALVKYLENIPDNEIPKLEIATGAVYVYQIDEKGNVQNKEIRGNLVNTV